MSNLQPNCCLKFDFQKVDQHAGGKWLIHDTKSRSCKAWNSPAEYPSWVKYANLSGKNWNWIQNTGALKSVMTRQKENMQIYQLETATEFKIHLTSVLAFHASRIHIIAMIRVKNNIHNVM